MADILQTIFSNAFFKRVLAFCFKQHWSLFLRTKWQLRWRHNRHDGVSNYQPYDCLLNRLFGHRSKKTSKLRVTGLCAGNSPGTGEFPAQMTSTAEDVSIWWRHHEWPVKTKSTDAIWRRWATINYPMPAQHLSIFHRSRFPSWNLMIKYIMPYLRTHWDNLRLINSSRPSMAYMRQSNRQVLAQIMACHLIGTKPLSELMLAYGLIGPVRTKFGGFESKYNFYLRKCRLQSDCHFVAASICYNADFRLAPSHWETSLQSNAAPHWLGANLESALC